MNLLKHFQKTFITDAIPHTYFATGRINLIGEHIDYNGGHVFPAAISFGTYALAVKRKDQRLRFFSMNIPDEGIIESHLSDTHYDENDGWSNYVKGMIFYLQKKGFQIESGLDILFFGNIPYGAGLSSSASLEMVSGVLLQDIFQLEISMLELVKIAQKVENKYIGVNSGIMDQFSVGFGKENKAILLNTNSLHFKYAPLQLKDYSILIMDTNKQRALADSKYNERYQECQEALHHFKQVLSIEHLCDLTVKQFEEHKHVLPNQTVLKRAKHVITENERTIQAFHCLKNHQLAEFGKLMIESHKSLQKDYEVTGKELDTIVEAALDQKGVLGARMTGAGFGGCAIALVEQKELEHVKANVQEIYQAKTGLEASFYTAEIVDGAKRISDKNLP